MENKSFPAIVIQGWKQPNPGLTLVKNIIEVLKLEVQARMVRARGCPREHLIKVLFWSNADRQQILNNKSMLRGTKFSKLFIRPDKFPSHWEKELEQEGEERPRRREERVPERREERATDRRKEGASERREERAPDQGKGRREERPAYLRGPRTETHAHIYDQLEQEAKRASSGNGGRAYVKSSKFKGKAGWRKRY